MKLTFWEVAAVVEAENDWQQWPDFDLHNIEFDSRVIGENDFFVPLKGTTDGHLFVNQAIENGAKGAFWSLSTPAPDAFPVLKVTDSLQAMQKIAVYYLQKVKPSVIAITGSNGKTTTKDMTEAVLAQSFQTYKTQGNYNNDIGLPYTILHMPETTEKLILEMGMDHAHEIDFLSMLAQPDVAAITMIGEAHIENLGSREKIAQAKMEITAGLSNTGLLLVPADEPLLLPRYQNLSQTVQTFGLGEANYQAEVTATEKEETRFLVNGYTASFIIPVPGAYNVTNALIAIAIGEWFAVPEEKIRQGLASFQLTKNRTEWVTTNSGIELLSDVYNANPTAMKLVLDSVSQLATAGRKIAVLGDMLELGEESAAMHASIAAHLDPTIIAEVFLYGEEMSALEEVLRSVYEPSQIHYFTKAEKEGLITLLTARLKPTDMVVLKASNGMGLNEVVKKLMEC